MMSAVGRMTLSAWLSCSLLGLGIRPAHAADPSYSLRWEVPAAKRGERALVRLHLAPGKGYHVNKEFPTALTVAVLTGVAVDKPTSKVEEAGADFEVALTAAEPGKKVVTGDLKFAVCSATSCDPKREKVSFTVDVK